MSLDSEINKLTEIHKECVKKLIPFILCIKSIQLPSQYDNEGNPKSKSQKSIDKGSINDLNKASVQSIMKQYESFSTDFENAFTQPPIDYVVYGGITSNDPTSDDNIERILKFYESLFGSSLDDASKTTELKLPQDVRLADILVSLSKEGSILTTPESELPTEISTDDINAILEKLDKKIKSDYEHLLGGKRIKKHKRTVKSKKRTTKRRPRRKSTAIKHRHRRRTSRK
jgi:hypothetical protein